MTVFSILTTLGLYVLIFALFFARGRPKEHWYFTDIQTSMVLPVNTNPESKEIGLGPMIMPLGGK